MAGDEDHDESDEMHWSSWNRLVAHIRLVTKMITMMVHDDIHWSQMRFYFFVSFDCEGLFPG